MYEPQWHRYRGNSTKMGRTPAPDFQLPTPGFSPGREPLGKKTSKLTVQKAPG